MAFVKVHSCMLFNEDVTGVKVLTPRAQEAWNHLRLICMHYMDLSSGHSRRQPSAEASRWLLEYGKICQEEEAFELLKPNLHRACCILQAQEDFLGPVGQMSELWVERAMRTVSSTDCKKSPEATLAIRHTIEMALRAAKQKIHLGD